MRRDNIAVEPEIIIDFGKLLSVVHTSCASDDISLKARIFDFLLGIRTLLKIVFRAPDDKVLATIRKNVEESSSQIQQYKVHTSCASDDISLKARIFDLLLSMAIHPKINFITSYRDRDDTMLSVIQKCVEKMSSYKQQYKSMAIHPKIDFITSYRDRDDTMLSVIQKCVEKMSSYKQQYKVHTSCASDDISLSSLCREPIFGSSLVITRLVRDDSIPPKHSSVFPDFVVFSVTSKQNQTKPMWNLHYFHRLLVTWGHNLCHLESSLHRSNWEDISPKKQSLAEDYLIKLAMAGIQTQPIRITPLCRPVRDVDMVGDHKETVLWQNIMRRQVTTKHVLDGLVTYYRLMDKEQFEDTLSTMGRDNDLCCNNAFHIRQLLLIESALGTYKDANVLCFMGTNCQATGKRNEDVVTRCDDLSELYGQSNDTVEEERWTKAKQHLVGNLYTVGAQRVTRDANTKDSCIFYNTEMTDSFDAVLGNETFCNIYTILDVLQCEVVNHQTLKDVANDHVRAGSRTTAEAQGTPTPMSAWNQPIDSAAMVTLTTTAHFSTSVVSRHTMVPVRRIPMTFDTFLIGYKFMIEDQMLTAPGLNMRYDSVFWQPLITSSADMTYTANMRYNVFWQYHDLITSSATAIHNHGSFVIHDCREQSGMDRLFPVSKKPSVLHIATVLKELMKKNVLDVFHFGKIMTDLDFIFGLSSSPEMKSVGEAQIYYIYLVMGRKALLTLEAPQLEVTSCDDGRNGKLIKDAMEERASQRLREGNMVTISSKNNTIMSMPEKDLNSTFVRITSLPYSQLPVPELDITVAIMQASTQAPQFPELMTILQQLADGEPVSAHVTMRYELLRVCTLKNYPKKGKIYLTLLAGAGFYYAGDEDELICYCCGVRRRNWTAQEKPRAVHVRLTPLCKFLKDNKTVNVPVPIQNHEKFSKIDAIPDLPRHELVNQQAPEDVSNDHVRAGSRTTAEAQGAQTAATGLTPAAHSSTSGAFAAQIPKYPQYATRAARLATYQGWPMETSCPRSEQLSEAGFFYAGVGDCVRCFFCGIGLRHWTEDDDPWVEHARFGKTCLYLRKKKGEEFIREIQQAYERRSNGVDVKNTSESNHPEDVMARHLLSDAAQSVLGMGYQPSIIKQGIQALISGGDRKFSAQELMEKILDIEEAAKASASSPPTGNAASTRPTSSRPPLVVGAAPVSCGVAAGNATAVDTQPTAIVSDGNSMDSKKEAGKTNSAAQTKKRETTKINFKGSNATDKMTGKQLREENERLREQSQCRVCLNNPTNTVFLPCGHLVTCTDCAAALRNCPICRTLIKGTVKTYAD